MLIIIICLHVYVYLYIYRERDRYTYACMHGHLVEPFYVSVGGQPGQPAIAKKNVSVRISSFVVNK